MISLLICILSVVDWTHSHADMVENIYYIFFKLKHKVRKCRKFNEPQILWISTSV